MSPKSRMQKLVNAFSAQGYDRVRGEDEEEESMQRNRKRWSDRQVDYMDPCGSESSSNMIFK